MNRRQLAFIVLVNALVSFIIALLVAWAIEARRPDPEELAALSAPPPQPVLAATPTPNPAVQGTDPAAPPPAAPTLPAAIGQTQIYVVQAGDILSNIAGRFNVTMEAIMQANGLSNPDFLFSGQRLVIPTGGAPSTVAAATAVVQIDAVEAAGVLDSEAALIVNDGNTPVNLQGWQLERENGPVYTFGSVPLFPGGSIRVFSRAGQDNSVALYWGRTEPVWIAGSVGRLVDPAGQPVHSRSVP